MITKTKVLKAVSGCTLSVTRGTFNRGNRKYVRVYLMTSPSTGEHSINTFSSKPDERVLNHWNGFLTNQ